MNKNDLFQSFGAIDDDILARSEVAAPYNRKPVWLKWGTLAACFVLVIAASVIGSHIQSPDPIAPITQINVASDSPTGISKYLNYNGCRYRFIENGSTFALDQNFLAEPLGTLEYDITADPKAYGSKDYATTFAQGGTIYEMQSYDPAFRVAVELNGKFYICENVDNTDGSDVDVTAYFEAANFKETVTEISVYDHFGREELTRLSGKNVIRMIEVLSEVTPAVLSNDDYSEIGKAQKSGESFLLVFHLADTTRYQMYVIPSLSIAMIGNNRYILTDEFHNAFDATFAGLNQNVAQQYH